MVHPRRRNSGFGHAGIRRDLIISVAADLPLHLLPELVWLSDSVECFECSSSSSHDYTAISQDASHKRFIYSNALYLR